MRTIGPALMLAIFPAAAHAQTATTTHPHAPMGILYHEEGDAHRAHISQISPADERFIGRLGAKVDLAAMMGDQRRYARHYQEARAIARCMVDPEQPQASFELTVAQHRACLLEGEAMDALSLRAALAEEQGRGRMPLPDRAMSIDVDAVERFSGLVPGVKVDMTMIARCAAVYSPGLAARVLGGEPGDEDTENAALDALYRATPECGLRQRPEGLSSTFQRAALAVALDEAVEQHLVAEN